MLHAVPIEKLADVWPTVAKWIDDAILYGQGDENLLDVFVALARGVYVLWYDPGKYAVVAQVQAHPRQKVGVILYCGGSDIAEIQRGFKEGKHHCAQHGIDVIRTYGRSGWAKVLNLKQVGVILQDKTS